VTAVTGQWTVPDGGLLPPGVASTWVGIGGFGTSDLIQAGTIEDSTPLAGFVDGGSYAAWYEILPDSPVYFTGCNGDPNCTVAPGDNITTTITWLGGNSWTIHMGSSRGWNKDIPIQYASSRSSAEWIHEAPSLLGVPIPVGNANHEPTFDGNNTVTVGNGSAVVIGNAVPAALAYDALPFETTTSSLDNDGDGFTVCTYALNCNPPSS